MDPVAATGVRFGPDRRLTAASAVGAVALLVACLLTSDPPGRLLWALAALLLAGYSASDLLWPTRLAADSAGVRIRTPFTRSDLPWDDVEDVRADVRTRYGLRTATLEVDGGEVLVVFGRRGLGVDPEHAAALIGAFRPPR